MELIFASATEQAKAIREKQISSEELTQACLARIAEVNPKLNAVVQLPAATALAEARAADRALARGEIRRPLHGVPFTLKDAIETEGVVSTGGNPGPRELCA
jgi:amidase